MKDLVLVSIREYCNQLSTELVALRRELHQIPEVGLDLPLTQARVLKALDGPRLFSHRFDPRFGLG